MGNIYSLDQPKDQVETTKLIAILGEGNGNGRCQLVGSLLKAQSWLRSQVGSPVGAQADW